MNKQEFNIASNSKNEIEVGLSNLSYNPFNFNGVNYASIEAFWQSLKFEEGSDEWKECIALSGVESKKYGNRATKKEFFIYNGAEYKVGSKEHQELMKEALREQLKQNPDKLRLLISTGETNLIHKPRKEDGTYYPDSTTIPGEIFSKFLMELRGELNGIETLMSKKTTNIGETLNSISQDKGLTDQLFNRIEDQNLSYSKMSEDEKQKYWIGVITKVFHDLEEGEKINISEYRETEPNIDLFLNSIIENIESYHWEDRMTIISKYFILDDIAKSYLKTEEIKGLDISFEELAKRLGDLFYEPLASVLNSISIELDKQIDDNEELVKLLKEASNHILKAWDHCKPYVTDINELERNSKHTFDIKGTSLTNKQISRAIAYLENHKLKEFLELLSTKIQSDSEADKGRGRIKLANELFACAEKLKEASKIL